MDDEDTHGFRLPDVTAEERTFTPEEHRARRLVEQDNIRRFCSYLLISIALFVLLGSPLIAWSLVFVIMAFLIWPYPKQKQG